MKYHEIIQNLSFRSLQSISIPLFSSFFAGTEAQRLPLRVPAAVVLPVQRPQASRAKLAVAVAVEHLRLALDRQTP
jgi:hypothetical protein